MLRTLYITLLRLHPGRFKYRFGDEMVSIFDEARGNESVAPLFGDAFVSLFRQWVLRRGSPRAQAVAATHAEGVPLFYTFHDGLPSKSALMNGAVLAVATFAAVMFAIRSGGTPHGFLIGSHHPHHSHLLPVRPGAPPSELNTELTTEVSMRPDVSILDHDPMRPVIIGYFRGLAILDALDVNHDLVISDEEMRNAPAVLKTFDADGDGQVTPAEIGSSTDRTRPGFMRVNPVLAALDRDHDGIISAEEISEAGASLAALDRNHDGRLTWREVLPEPVALEVFLLFRLDRNGDGVLSREERANPFAALFSEVFDAADRDHDGAITGKELVDEVKRRADLDGDGVVTWEEMVAAPKNGLLGPKR